MIMTPELVVTDIAVAAGAVVGDQQSLFSLACSAVSSLKSTADVGAVIAATFSNPDRFPSLAVRVVSELKLPNSTPAFDLQLACSAYPYALYLAGKLAADIGKKVLVIDGDVQSRLVDPADHATGNIFSDAVTATIVDATVASISTWAFLSKYDTALACPESGPIYMDGMKVFTFVATEIVDFLRPFGTNFDYFVPHQANPYMIRQLSKSLGLTDKLLTLDESIKNPGSASVAMTLAASHAQGRVLIAGFGAGYSASAGIVRVELT